MTPGPPMAPEPELQIHDSHEVSEAVLCSTDKVVFGLLCILTLPDILKPPHPLNLSEPRPQATIKHHQIGLLSHVHRQVHRQRMHHPSVTGGNKMLLSPANISFVEAHISSGYINVRQTFSSSREEFWLFRLLLGNVSSAS